MKGIAGSAAGRSMSVKCMSVKGEAERKQSAETLDPTGNNPLVWAAEKGQAQVAGFLLAQGVDVNHRGYMGNTALARAARGGHVECLRVLLGFPATNPNIAVLLSPDRD